MPAAPFEKHKDDDGDDDNDNADEDAEDDCQVGQSVSAYQMSVAH